MHDSIYDHPEIYDIFYSDKAYVDETEFMVERIEENCPDPERVLVVGCGTGNHLNGLLEAGYDIVALDQNQEMLRVARESFPEVSFRHQSFPDIDVDGPFDAVLFPYYIVNYITSDDLERGIDVTDRLLSPNGTILLDWAVRKSESEVELTVRRTQEADYCFLTKISPQTDTKDQYVHFMLTDGGGDKGLDFRIFGETITHHDWLVPALRDHGYNCDTYDGYETDG